MNDWVRIEAALQACKGAPDPKPGELAELRASHAQLLNDENTWTKRALAAEAERDALRAERDELRADKRGAYEERNRRGPRVKPTSWIPFERQRPPRHKRCLVTNNLSARDAHGQMSHIWIGWPQQSSGPTDSFPHTPEKGSWFCFTDTYDRVVYLTHWMALPAGEERTE